MRLHQIMSYYLSNLGSVRWSMGWRILQTSMVTDYLNRPRERQTAEL